MGFGILICWVCHCGNIYTILSTFNPYSTFFLYSLLVFCILYLYFDNNVSNCTRINKIIFFLLISVTYQNCIQNFECEVYNLIDLRKKNVLVNIKLFYMYFKNRTRSFRSFSLPFALYNIWALASIFAIVGHCVLCF